MMRLIFGFLLVLSLVLFALMQWGDGLTGTSRNTPMLAELNPDKIKLLDRPVLPVSAVLEVQSAVAAAPLATSAVSAVLPASAPLGVAVKAAASAPSAASASAVAVAPPLQSSPATVPTAAPVPAALPAPVAVHVPVQAPLPPPKTASHACMEWGEFSGPDLARTSKAVSALNLGERVTQHKVEYSSGYWVYIPPLKNKAAVNQKIAQIKALGIEDFYVIHEPPKLGNVISLGVFKTHEAAKNYLASLQKKGIRTAVVGERKRKLKFIVFEFKHLEVEAVTQLRKLQKEFVYSELKTLLCNNEKK